MLNNIERVKMKKIIKEDKLSELRAHSGIPVNGIWGILVLFVVASIAFSTYMVYFGTDSLVNKIMLVPQVIFAATFLLIKAAK